MLFTLKAIFFRFLPKRLIFSVTTDVFEKQCFGKFLFFFIYQKLITVG